MLQNKNYKIKNYNRVNNCERGKPKNKIYKLKMNYIIAYVRSRIKLTPGPNLERKLPRHVLCSHLFVPLLNIA